MRSHRSDRLSIFFQAAGLRAYPVTDRGVAPVSYTHLDVYKRQVQECVKSGSSYALVVGDKVYTLAGMPQSVAPFAGKHVHVEGSLKDNTITITSISDAMPKGMKM